MPPIYLTEQDVNRLLDEQVALEAVEEAFQQLAAGRAHNVARRRARAPGIVLHSMSAAAEYLDRVGWKQYTTTKTGARFLVGVYEAATGELAALIEADRLGRLRTGAATAVAVRHLASATAERLALIGCGQQAESQLAAVAAVRPLRTVSVYCRTADRRQAFADKMSLQLQLEVAAVPTARAAVEGSEIVVTATTSRQPVVESAWVPDGATVCAVGSNALDRSELDVPLVARAAGVICDQVEACRDEAGELAAAAQQGAFDWQAAVELSDVVAANVPGRTSDQEVLIFKSVGLAIEDLALASRLVNRARAAGVGRAIETE